MNIGILYGVAGGHHHPVSKVDSDMTFSRSIVGSLEENKVSGLCFDFGNVLALVPQAVGSGAPHIIAVLVVHPADVATAIEPGFRGGAAPDVGCAHILLGFLVDGGELLISQGFCRNLIINARRARAIGATGRQASIEQVGSAAQRILKDLVAFPLVVIQFLPDNYFQYRDPLRLLAMGYTNREIAKSLGLTDEVVRMRLFRGRKLLWKELNHHE